MSGSGEARGEREELAEVLRGQGVPEDLIHRAIERDDPEGAVLEAATLPERASRTVSAADVEAQGGLSATEVIEIVQALGFPPPDPDEPALTPEEARVFVELGKLRDVWPQELSQQSARLYGRLLARIARAGVQLFRLYAEPRVRARGGTRAEQLSALREAWERLGSLPDPLLAGVHRRWLEYELAQAWVSAGDSRGLDAEAPGAVEIALLFCDLKDFTAYANAEGDAAAVEAIDAFAQTVDSERGANGKVVKALGDGQMICYSDTTDAVEAGARIISGMQDRGPLGVHASVHRGAAIAREGDYFGEAVNLAARLLAAAGRDELVATAAVVEDADRFPWEPLGVRRIRGVSDPVEVFRLRGDRDGRGPRRTSP
jgi:class 3 adenylate cyclase